jgi:signal transduction histidine kinase
MQKNSNRLKWRFVGSDIGFVAVVGVAYFSALLRAQYGGAPHSVVAIFVLVTSSLLYLIAGTYGFAVCRRQSSGPAVVSYLFGQVILAGTVIYLLPNAGAFLILLPLAGQSFILLPRIRAGMFSLLLLAMLAVPVGWTAGLAVGVVASAFFLAGMVLVVTFTLMAVNEANSRQQVERLAAELSEANQRLTEYASQTAELATLRERGRLAREIHDSLGHYLTAVNVLLEAARAVLGKQPERADEIMRQAQTLTREGLTEVRRAVTELRNESRDIKPLTETLESLVNECRVAGIEANLIITGEPSILSPEARLTLYRAAQEALTNVRRHSQASCVDMNLDFSDVARVRLRIADDGVGVADTKKGFGLVGIQERAEILGGEVFVRSEPGAGFALEVELPR